MKFGVGQPVRRFEDQTLITGKGNYTDDIKLPEHVLRLCAARAGGARQYQEHRRLQPQRRSPACCWS